MNDFLLNLFTSSDELRPLMRFPNLEDGMVYATDAHAAIAIPENELSLKYSTDEKYPDIHSLLDGFLKKELQSIRVNVFDLAKELAKARVEVDKDSVKCKECAGSGTVEFEYSDKKNETHYIDGDCPVCDGQGSNEKESNFARIKLSMIEKEDGTQAAISINDLYFHPFQLYRLFMVAALKRVDDFEILHDPNSYGPVVSIFGNVKVLIMMYARPDKTV